MSDRLPGHELANEGAPFKMNPQRRGSYIRLNYQGTGGTGRGLCTCGATSDMLTSGTKRKAWHREHKAAVRRGEMTR